MASDFIVNKWKKTFSMFDINKDCVINKEDASMFGQKFATLTNRNEAAAEDMRSDISEFYESFFLRGGSETTEEQFIRSMTEALAKSQEEFYQYTRKHFAILVSAVDANNDGLISVKELRNLQKAFGIMTFHKKHYEAFPRVQLPCKSTPNNKGSVDTANSVSPSVANGKVCGKPVAFKSEKCGTIQHGNNVVHGSRGISKQGNDKIDITRGILQAGNIEVEIKRRIFQPDNSKVGIKHPTTQLSRNDIAMKHATSESDDINNTILASKSVNTNERHATSEYANTDKNHRMNTYGGAVIKRNASKLDKAGIKTLPSQHDTIAVNCEATNTRRICVIPEISINRNADDTHDISKISNLNNKQGSSKDGNAIDKQCEHIGVKLDDNNGLPPNNRIDVSHVTPHMPFEDTDGIKSELFLESWVAFCCNNDESDMHALEKARLFGFRMLQSIDIDPESFKE